MNYELYYSLIVLYTIPIAFGYKVQQPLIIFTIFLCLISSILLHIRATPAHEVHAYFCSMRYKTNGHKCAANNNNKLEVWGGFNNIIKMVVATSTLII